MIEEGIEAIGYIRQSDERTDKEDISEQTQLTKIQQYCDFNGWKLVKVFKDIDYSGFRIRYTKRPGLMEAFEFIKTAPKVRKFVIFNLSRATRLKKDFSLIQETLSSFNIDICSASETLDFSTPTGRLVAGVLVDFNEYYSDNLSDVTSQSKKTNAEKGRWNGGPAPFGLVKHDGGFISDGSKGDAVTESFRMARSGKGPYRIAKWLKLEGILTETGVAWTPRRVRYMLTNPTYAAMQEWDGNYYPLKGFQKLVEWEDFLYIQRTLFGKEKAWKGRENRQLLTSVLRCPVCGSKMYSRKTLSKKTRRYVCCRKNQPGSCTSAVVDSPSLNEVVVNTIIEMAKFRYSRDEFVSQIAGMTDTDSTNSMQHLREEYNRLEEARQNVFDDFYVYKKMDEKQFNVLMKRYEDRQAEIGKLLEKIPMPLKNKYGDYDDLINEFGQTLTELPPNDQRKLIELLVEKITPGKPTVVSFRWGETKEIPVAEVKFNRSGVYFYQKK